MTLMDLLARGTCVPAVTARGAIVEKGLQRCKAIGDYLNNHRSSTWHKTLWERACSRMRSIRQHYCRLTHPSRAGSLVCLDLKGWAGLQTRFWLWPVQTVGDFSSRPFYPKRQ